MTLEHSDYALIGTAVIAAQKVEFALFGIASHLSDPAKGPSLRKITARDFLSGAPEKRKLRKATLGVLAHEHGKTLMLPEDRLEAYVERRNILVHEFWREAVSGKGSGAIKEPRTFLRAFIEESDHWISALRGLLSFLQEAAATREGRQAEYKMSESDKRYREVYVSFVKEALA